MTKNTFIQSLKKIPRAYLFFGIFCFLFTALMVFVEIKNGRFWTNDFKVYYDATTDYFSGIFPYNKAYGLTSGYFKYPPTTFFMFLIYKGFPYFVAQLIHISLLCISYIVSVVIIHKTFIQNSNLNSSKKYYGLLYLAFFFSAIHLVRELHMGNINLFLLVFFLLGLTRINKSKFQTAVFWSFMVILKPIVILAFLPLFFYKQWRIILYMGGFGIFFFLVPIVYAGWVGNLDLWKGWLDAILFHGDYIINQTSISYLCHYYIGFKSEWIPSLIVLLVLLSFFVYDLIHSKFKENKLMEWLIVFLAFTPNFFKTDTEHFLLSLPLIMLLVKKLIVFQKKFMWIPFVLLAAGFSLNSNDLLGKELSTFVSEHGFLGLANLGFIALCLILSNLQITSQLSKR